MVNKQNSWQAHIKHVSDIGVLAMRLYVIQTWPVADLEKVKKHLDQHLGYQLELENKGILFAAGPLANDAETSWSGEGLVIIRADSIQAAKKIAQQDPMHQSGARDYRIRPWLLNEGSITLNLKLSSKGLEVK